MSERNPFLVNLVPHSARRGEYKPVEGAFITISLPGEMTRAKVHRVIADDAILAKIDSIPMGRGHTYKKDDIVPCRRCINDALRSEQWEVVSERKLDLAERAEKFEQQEKERLAAAEAEKAKVVAPGVEATGVPVPDVGDFA
jgi:hypothetical protein